jgi:hypothetical protein
MCPEQATRFIKYWIAHVMTQQTIINYRASIVNVIIDEQTVLIDFIFLNIRFTEPSL